MLIDVHTHSRNETYCSFIDGVHSKGIHPWQVLAPFAPEQLKEQFAVIYAERFNLWGIGECGLDRAREGLASITDQIKVLQWHLQLSLEIKRPVILHCVRAYSDLLGVLKNSAYHPSLLLHGFSGNAQQVLELSKFPLFFSLGKNIFYHRELITLIPMDRLLLESDDQKDIGIEQIYQEAARQLGMDLSLLEEQLEKNFLRLFNQAHDIGAADFFDNFC